MKDQDKTKAQLIAELEELRRRLSALETSETQWQRTEEALQGSEERFRLLVEAIPQPIWRSDAEGNVMEFNRRWYEYTGQTAEEAQGSGWTQALHPDEAAMVVGKVRAGIAGGAAIEIVNRLRRASDGSYRWHLARAVPVNDRSGKIIGWFGCATDIDDQKRAEEALKQSEQRLSLHFQQTPLAAIEWDVEGRVTKWNPAAERIFGYSQAEALGCPVSFIVPPHVREHVAHVSDDLRADRGGQRSTNENVTKDGRTILCEWYNTPLIDAAGQMVGVASLAQDITEQKQAEAAIKAKHAILEGILESANAPVFSVDKHYRYTSFNKTHAATMKAIYGADIELGKSLLEYQTVGDDRKKAQDNLDRALRGEQFICEECSGEDFRLRPFFEVSHNPIKNADGEVVGVAILAQDITLRKRAEAVLRESEERFRTIADFTYDWEYWRGTDNRFIYVSPSCQRITGYTPADFMADPGLLEKVIHPDDGQRISDHLCAETPPSASFTAEFRVISKTGEERWIEHICQPVFGNDRRWLGQRASNRDITDRKRAEEALQKVHDELERRVQERTAELLAANEQLRVFHQFAEASSQGFGMADLGGHLLYVNPAFCRMVGIDSPEEYIGQHLSICYSEEADRKGREEIEPHLKEHGRWEGELPLLSRQGKSTPTWHSAFLIRHETGAPSRMAVVITDITERKAAQETLRLSEERYKLLADHVEDFVSLEDSDGGHVYISPSYFRRTGWTPEDLAATDWRERMHPDDLPHIERAKAAAKAGETVTFEHRIRCRNGSWIWVEQNFKPLFDADGNLRKQILWSHDITKRKQAEENLRASEERFRTYFLQGLVGMSITGSDMHWQEVNDRLCEISGYSREELLRMTWMDLTHPDDLNESLSLYHRLKAGEIDHFQQETRYIRQDGKIIYASVFVRYTRRTDGTVDQFLGLIQDITERKQAQGALERERQSLWHMLQASDHERQIISYEIHDGLAQYLAGAGMQLQMFEHFRETNPQEAKTAYDAAVQLVREAHSESRRLISGVRPPILDEEGLELAISHLVHDRRVLKGPKIEYKSDVQFSRLPSILEDSLYRIAQEALTNACTHSNSIKVTVTLTQENQDVRLEVRDWGVGFDLESVEKGHFGLEGIRQRMRLLRGRLKIESKPGAGAVVQAVVPIVERKGEE